MGYAANIYEPVRTEVIIPPSAQQASDDRRGWRQTSAIHFNVSDILFISDGIKKYCRAPGNRIGFSLPEYYDVLKVAVLQRIYGRNSTSTRYRNPREEGV